MNFKKKFMFTLIEIALVVIAFILFSGTAVSYVAKTTLGTFTTNYSGFESFLGSSDVFDVSVGGIIVVILVVAAVALNVVKMLMPKNAKVLNLVIAALAIVAAVFLFCGTTDLMLNFENGKKVADMTGSAFGQSLSLKLGAGSIVSALLLIVTGVLTLLEAFVLKRK